MDLQSVRTRFFERKVQYACSYDAALAFGVNDLTLIPGGIRVQPQRRPAEAGAPAAFGHVFHVLDALSVMGTDGLKHDCPVGTIEDAWESLTFVLRDGARGPVSTGMATVEGRMTLKTKDRATIDVRYDGVLRFPPSVATALLGFEPDARALACGAWVVPRFDTSDSRYGWLGDRACVAFGRWVAEPEGARRAVSARYDVYSTG